MHWDDFAPLEAMEPISPTGALSKGTFYGSGLEVRPPDTVQSQILIIFLPPRYFQNCANIF